MTAAILAGIVTTIGIYVIRKYAKWGKKNVIHFISFAAGVLIAVSFMHIIPESFKMNARAPLFLLIGFLVLYLVNRFLNVFVCCKPGKELLSFGLVPAIGIGIHSFIDGIIYSVTFNVAIFTGVMAAVGMVLHEFPEGIVTFLFLMKSGFSKSKSALYAFIAAGITTPLGALVSYPFIHKLTPSVLGIMLALSAGALVYVGASHLLPHTEKEHEIQSLLTMAAGIAAAALIIMSHG